MKIFKHLNKRKRIDTGKLIKCINGSISILLCLIITPFLTVAAGLAEYARYQEAIEINDEIYELTGISLLANYDQYIHNRFGLLSVSQAGGKSMEENATEQFEKNIAQLKTQISLNGRVTAEGRLPLVKGNDYSVLKKQVLNVSELTVPTAILTEDLEIFLNLLNAIPNAIQEIGTLIDVISDMSELTQILSYAVDRLSNLKENV